MPRRNEGSWAHSHSDAIRRAEEMQARALGHIADTWSQGAPEAIDLARLSYDDLARTLDAIGDDPAAQADFDENVANQLLPLIEQALNREQR